jgi:hypothetical protein
MTLSLGWVFERSTPVYESEQTFVKFTLLNKPFEVGGSFNTFPEFVGIN